MLSVFEILLTLSAALVDGPMLGGGGHAQHAAGLPMTWRLERRTDPASGEKSCRVVSLGGNVTVRFVSRGAAAGVSISVRIGFDNQPGSLRYLRVNRHIFQTDRQSFSGPEAGRIVAQLKSPGEFSFEWAKRPDFGKQQGLFGTGDFAPRADACVRWLYGKRV